MTIATASGGRQRTQTDSASQISCPWPRQLESRFGFGTKRPPAAALRRIHAVHCATPRMSARNAAELSLTGSSGAAARRRARRQRRAQPPKARAAHAGPHRGTRHIRTAHPPGSIGRVLGRSFLIVLSLRRPAATSVPPRRGLRPRLRPGHPATTVTTWSTTT